MQEHHPIIEIKDFEGRFTRVIFAGIDISSCVKNVSYRTNTEKALVGSKADFTLEINLQNVVDLLSELKDEDLNVAREIIRRHREMEGGSETRHP